VRAAVSEGDDGGAFCGVERELDAGLRGGEQVERVFEKRRSELHAHRAAPCERKAKRFPIPGDALEHHAHVEVDDVRRGLRGQVRSEPHRALFSIVYGTMLKIFVFKTIPY
jgi:hypothetical protein